MTVGPSVPGRVLDYVYCPAAVVPRTTFHFQNCPGLDEKLDSHTTRSLPSPRPQCVVMAMSAGPTSH